MATRKNSGFTLIELLIVLIIVGTVITLVSLNIGAKPSLAKQAANQLQNLLELAQDEAVLKGQILGLKLTVESYEFYRYRNKLWQPIIKDNLLRHYKLHPGLNYQLNVDNLKVKNDKNTPPQIILFPDGTMNNFVLLIQPKDLSENYQVAIIQGKITSQLVENKK